MSYGKFIYLTGEIDIATDADLSEVIDFGVPVHLLWVYVPTITSATVDIQVCVDDPKDEDVTPTTFVVAATDILAGAGVGGALALTDDSDNDIRGFRHFKLATSAGQAADRTFILAAQCV